MTQFQMQQLLTLPIEERVDLLERLHRSLLGEPLPAWQQELLDERVRQADANPASFVTWEEVERDLLAVVHPARHPSAWQRRR